jgi:hypothetical protein
VFAVAHAVLKTPEDIHLAAEKVEFRNIEPAAARIGFLPDIEDLIYGAQGRSVSRAWTLGSVTQKAT